MFITVRVESTSFTAEDVRRLLEELVDHDRELLVRRLERASARLRELAGRMPEQAPSQPQSQEREWNAQEVLAHIAVFSKFYGVVGSKIGKGQVAEFGLAAQVGQRDVFGERLAALPPGEWRGWRWPTTSALWAGCARRRPPIFYSAARWGTDSA